MPVKFRSRRDKDSCLDSFPGAVVPTRADARDPGIRGRGFGERATNEAFILKYEVIAKYGLARPEFVTMPPLPAKKL
jgi:hypothetical protein